MLRVLLPALATCCATNSVLQVAGKLHALGDFMNSLTWKRQPKLFKFDSRRHRSRIWRVFGGERDYCTEKRADSLNEKWPENLACCHKRLYLNACAAYDGFPLRVEVTSCRNVLGQLATWKCVARQDVREGERISYSSRNWSLLRSKLNTRFFPLNGTLRALIPCPRTEITHPLVSHPPKKPKKPKKQTNKQDVNSELSFSIYMER